MADLAGVEDLPWLQVEGSVQPPRGFWRGHVDKPVSDVALVAVKRKVWTSRVSTSRRRTWEDNIGDEKKKDENLMTGAKKPKKKKKTTRMITIIPM